MDISLTPEMERAVKAKVDPGRKWEAESEWLKQEAAIGFAQLKAGETVQVQSKEEFMTLARRYS